MSSPRRIDSVPPDEGSHLYREKLNWKTKLRRAIYACLRKFRILRR